eukprot:6490498-Amphidinium_carterae.1
MGEQQPLPMEVHHDLPVVSGYEPNVGDTGGDGPRDVVRETELLMQQYSRIININAPPVVQPVLVVPPAPTQTIQRDLFYEYLQGQVSESSVRQQALRSEMDQTQQHLRNTESSFAQQRIHAEEWVQREGEIALTHFRNLESRAERTQQEQRILEQRALLQQTETSRFIEQRSAEVLAERTAELNERTAELEMKTNTCREMQVEGSSLLFRLHTVETERNLLLDEVARAESVADSNRREVVESTQDLMNKMHANVLSLASENDKLRAEIVQPSSSVRTELLESRREASLFKSEFVQTQVMHQSAMEECSKLRTHLSQLVGSTSGRLGSACSPLAGVTSDVSLNNKSLQSRDQVSTWTKIFSQSPIPPSPQAPVSSQMSSVHACPGFILEQSIPASLREVGSFVPSIPPGSIPTGSIPPGSIQPGSVPPGFGSVHQGVSGGHRPEEIRKDRLRLPKCEVSSDSNPANVLLAWETWVLKCGLSIGSWTRNPAEGTGTWNMLLEEATQLWQKWSLMTPSQRSLQEMLEASSGGGYTVGTTDAIEATLRVELCDCLPASVVKRAMTEQKVTSIHLLKLAMQCLLPSYHTVRVALLDAVEKIPSQKINTFPQLLTSLQSWLQTLRTAMGRYQVQPEPRRMWLSVHARVQMLSESNASFAPLVLQHIQTSNVRVLQTLESVLAFSMGIEAEVAAIVQDSTGSKTNAHAASSNTNPKQDTKKSDLKESSNSKPGNGASVCEFFQSGKGCRFGQNCKNVHPYVRADSGQCFVCGSKQHKSSECTAPRKGPSKEQPRGREMSKPRSASRKSASGASRGDSKPRTPRSASANSASSVKDDKKKRGRNNKKAEAKAVARALSLNADVSCSMDVLLDSGASHTVLPLSYLSSDERDVAVPVDLCLAAGKSQSSLICNGEVFAKQVRRPLIPLGKLVERTGLRVEWTATGMVCSALDENGRTRVVLRPYTRQGHMPHVDMSLLQGLRQALKLTRTQVDCLSFERWCELLGPTMFHDAAEPCGQSTEVVTRHEDKGEESERLCTCFNVLVESVSELRSQLAALSSSKELLTHGTGNVEVDTDCKEVLAQPALTDEDFYPPSVDDDDELNVDDDDDDDDEDDDEVNNEDGHDEMSLQEPPSSDFQSDGESVLFHDLSKYWSMMPGVGSIPTHNLETYLEHCRNGHYPKLKTCAVCQLADAPPFVHKRSTREEHGLLGIDISGPLASDMRGFKYLMIGAFVTVCSPVMGKSVANKTGKKSRPQRQELVLPFVKLLKSRDGAEVSVALKHMVEEIESMPSSVLMSSKGDAKRVLHVAVRLPDSEGNDAEVSEDLIGMLDGFRLPGDDKSVLRVHTDRASEFLSKEFRRTLESLGVHQSTTSSHSFQSNGRAENAIKLVKSIIRRSLVSSGFPVFFWGFAGLHAAQVLRSFSLRKVGETRKIPCPFGTYVCVRKVKYPKQLQAFESRGMCGRLLLENTMSNRLCWIVSDSGELLCGLVPAPVMPGTIMTVDSRPELRALWEDLGWKQVKLEGNDTAWFHQEEGKLILAPPVVLDETDVLEEIDAHSASCPIVCPDVDQSPIVCPDSSLVDQSPIVCPDQSPIVCPDSSLVDQSPMVCPDSSIAVPNSLVDETHMTITSAVACSASEEQLPLQQSEWKATSRISCRDRDRLRDLCGQVVSLLQNKTLPKLRSRTNIFDATRRNPPRGVLLGAFTRRGCGVSKATSSLMSLTEIVHQIAQLRSDPTPYASVFVSTSSHLPLHVDGNNAGMNDIISCGQYSGGRLFIEATLGEMYDIDGALCLGKTWDTHEKFLRFDPRRKHAVLPTEVGKRISIAFFSPKGLNRLTAAQGNELRAAGFNLDGVLDSVSDAHGDAGEVGIDSGATVVEAVETARSSKQDVQGQGEVPNQKLHKGVSFSEPLVVLLVTFEVEGDLRPTTRGAKRAITGKRSVANVAIQELKDVPDVTALHDLAKSIPLSLEAIRKTTGREREAWKASLSEELEKLRSQHTYDPMEKPSDAEIFPVRCVFTIKPKSDGSVKRRSRIVLCGNFITPFSSGSTSNLDSTAFRVVLAVTLFRGWMIGATDIPGAFLNAFLGCSRKVYCEPARILKDMDLVAKNEVWLLNKALYGLREAPKLWQDELDSQLRLMRFECDGVAVRLLQSVVHASIWLIVDEDKAVKVLKTRTQLKANRNSADVLSESQSLIDFQSVDCVEARGFLTVYVDDMCLCGSVQVVKALGAALDRKYGTKEPQILGIDCNEITHIGLQITFDEIRQDSVGQPIGYKRVMIHQSRYAEEVIERHAELFQAIKHTPSPPDAGKDILEESAGKSEQLVKRIQQVGGALLWMIVKTRPDMAFAYSQVASLQSRCPTLAWTRLKHLCSYLAGTSDLGLVFDSEAPFTNHIDVAADISFAPNGSYSQCGVLAKFRTAPVAWRSFKQSIVALSTCEGELIGACEGLETGRIIQILLSELWSQEYPNVVRISTQSRITPIALSCDNQAAIAQILKGNQAAFRSRHISIRGMRIAQAIDEGSATITWVETLKQPADYLTKSFVGSMKHGVFQSMGLERVDA